MKNQFYSHTAIDSWKKIRNECKAGATKAQFLDYWQLTSKSTSARKVWAQVFLLPSLLCFFHHHVGMARSSTVLLFQLLSYSTDATKLKRKLHGIIVLLSLYLGLESGNYPKKSFPVCSQNFFFDFPGIFATRGQKIKSYFPYRMGQSFRSYVRFVYLRIKLVHL